MANSSTAEMPSNYETRHRRSSTPVDERFAKMAADLAVVYEHDPAEARNIRSEQIIASSSRRPPGFPAWPRFVLSDSVSSTEAVAVEAASPNTATDDRTIVPSTPTVKVTKSSPRQVSSSVLQKKSPPMALMPHLGYSKRKLSPTISPLRSATTPLLAETMNIMARASPQGTLQKQMSKENTDNLNGNGTSATFLKQDASKPGRKGKFVEKFDISDNSNNDNNGNTDDMTNLKMQKTREVEADRRLSDPFADKMKIVQHEERNIFNPFGTKAEVSEDDSDNDDGAALLAAHSGGTFRILNSSYTNTRPSVATSTASNLTMRPSTTSTEQTDITAPSDAGTRPSTTASTPNDLTMGPSTSGAATFTTAEAFTVPAVRPRTDTTTFDNICASNGLAIADSPDVGEHAPKLSGKERFMASARRISNVIKVGRKSVGKDDVPPDVPVKAYTPLKQDENEK